MFRVEVEEDILVMVVMAAIWEEAEEVMDVEENI